MTPRSSRNRIEVSDVGDIKVWVSAAPTDGQANQAVCELIAKKLGLPKTAVEVVRGETSRDKVLAVVGIDFETAITRLKS